MKRTIIAIIIATAAILAVVFGFRNAGTEERGGDIVSIGGRDFLLATYPEVNLSFRYPVENPEYILLAAEDELAEKIFVLMRKTDYEDFIETSDMPREGPPAITLGVFERNGTESALGWAERNTLVSNYGLKQGLTSDVEVGGMNGIRYTTDGLYIGETIVVMSGPYAYMFVGNYITKEDGFLSDFESIIKTIAFEEVL